MAPPRTSPRRTDPRPSPSPPGKPGGERPPPPRRGAPPAQPRPQAQPPKGQAPQARGEERELIHGFRAALAVLERRPEDVLELHYSPEAAPRLGEPLRWARGKGLPCREVAERELARRVETANHEGLCVVTRARRWLSPAELADQLIRSKGAAIALDRVRNPYNIGAILRSAAFFGIEGALLGAPAPHPALAPDAVRVAEGGAEHLLLSRTTDLADTLARLRSKGVAVIGAESDGKERLAGYRFRRPVVVVMGNEREGLGERIRAQCDELVVIQGGGAVGSLNVSIAASLMIAELVR